MDLKTKPENKKKKHWRTFGTLDMAQTYIYDIHNNIDLVVYRVNAPNILRIILSIHTEKLYVQNDDWKAQQANRQQAIQPR